MKKYICLLDYYNLDYQLCFKKGDVYSFEEITENVFYTHKNNLGYGHELDKDKINVVFDLILKEEPNHYDNSKGSLYQFCENQQLNSYEFDIIKRIMRCRKKGNFKEDLEKTKFLIDLYLKEHGTR